MRPIASLSQRRSDTIRARRDPLGVILWSTGSCLLVSALVLDPGRILPAAAATARPFLTLAVVITGAAIADHLGVFRAFARFLIPEQASPVVALAAVLTFTAILSGLVNLDVAVVVAMPVTMRVAQRQGLHGGWLAIATAMTANATSFLLPTSNLTTLLVLGRSPISSWTYLRESWVAWLAVTGLTVVGLALVLAGRPGTGGQADVERGASIGAVLELLPMFACATAIRALLGAELVLHGGFVRQAATGTLLAAGVNNLPAAAAVHVIGNSGPWAAILAMAIGPNVLLTGSVATLICRRIARDHGVRLGAARLSLLGIAVVPLQILVAVVGLHVTGALR
jgi:Na+/H+ antiporter NhaD/arsenite permease-like protein